MSEIELGESSVKISPKSYSAWKSILSWLYSNIGDLAVIIVAGALMFCGASWQIFNLYTDAAKYQCYAVHFWQGTQGIRALPASQCAFLGSSSLKSFIAAMQTRNIPALLVNFAGSQSPTLPFHALPHEYPLLTVIPFTLGLTAPSHWYQVAFAIWMAFLVGVEYFLIKHFASRGSAVIFAIYMVLGSWATAEGRFDLFPAILTLLSLIFAQKGRWKLSYCTLAFATMFKFYPVILIFPLFIAQQQSLSSSFKDIKRWSGILIFTAVCAGLTLVSLILSIDGTVGPLGYFGSRPVQVESVAASFLWLISFLGFKTHYVFTFGSLNIISPLSSIVSITMTALLFIGIVFICWLMIKKKLKLDSAFLLVLMVILVSGKVFSPQYLIWITPIVAYVGRVQIKWVLSWCTVCALTTWIYPYIYTESKHIELVPYLQVFFPAVTIRSLILTSILLVSLYAAFRKPQFTN